MAKYLGSLIGAILAARPAMLVSTALAGSPDKILARDTIELAAAATDVVQAAIVPWETVLSPASKVFFDDLGSGTTLSFGDINYPNALINAQDVATAAGNADAMKSVDIANYFKPLWQQLGYASLAAAKLIGPQCELLFRINTAAAAGTLSWQLIGHPL